jgi:ABC-type transporter Mla subunit MlaD
MKGGYLKIFFILAFFTACHRQKKTDLNILFDRVDNIAVGSEVRMHGFTIGEVNRLKMMGNGILVSISFKEKTDIPAGSKFSIYSPLIGSSVIDIKPSTQSIFLTKRDTATGKYDTKGLLDDMFSDSTRKAKANKAVEKIAEGIKELIEAKKDTSIQNK